MSNLDSVSHIVEVHSAFALDMRLAEFTVSLTTDMKKWKSGVKQALGEQLTGAPTKRGYPSTWFTKRLNRGALFPHRNTGALQRSIDYTLKAVKHSEVSASITVNTLVKGDTPSKLWKKDPTQYYEYAEKGLPAIGNKGSWTGWLSSVTTGDGRGSIRSVGDIFDQLGVI